MQAKDIMSKKIITVKIDSTIMEAVQTCVENKVSGLIVVDDKEEMIGVVSEKDLLVGYEFLQATDKPIGEFVSKDVVSIEEDTQVDEISRLLVQRNFKRVPVVKSNKPIGIVSRGDILKWIANK